MTKNHDNKERELPEGGGLIIAIVLAIIFWSILFVGCWMYLDKAPKRDHVVPDEIKNKMRYHGISVCYEDWKGNHYFIRGGKRCPL